MLFLHNALLGYNWSEACVLSSYLLLALVDPTKINDKLSNNLVAGCLFQVSLFPPFLYFLIMLAFKSNDEFQKIHHSSFPPGFSVHDCIQKELCIAVTLDNVFQKGVAVGWYGVIIKLDIKDIFRNILIAMYVRWLLGFCWRTCFYTENWLPFGLSTLSFIFNLFTEAFDWVLQFFLSWDLEQYLGNCPIFLPAV